MAGAAVPDAARFRRGLNRVDVFLSEQSQGQVRAAGGAIEALRLAERREALQQHLTQRLTDSMASMRTTPAIRRLVTGTWAQVIAAAMLGHGEQSEQAMATLKTVDDLLWSLQDPRPSPEPPASHRPSARIAAAAARGHGDGSPAGDRATRRARRADDDPHRRVAARHARHSRACPRPEEIVQRMRDDVSPRRRPRAPSATR